MLFLMQIRIQESQISADICGSGKFFLQSLVILRQEPRPACSLGVSWARISRRALIHKVPSGPEPTPIRSARNSPRSITPRALSSLIPVPTASFLIIQLWIPVPWVLATQQWIATPAAFSSPQLSPMPSVHSSPGYTLQIVYTLYIHI